MQAAALVHVDKRTWQRYEAGTSQIPGAIVELFAIKTGKHWPNDNETP